MTPDGRLITLANRYEIVNKHIFFSTRDELALELNPTNGAIA